MKIAYITNCFSTQSHTFMRREIRALRRLDVSLVLFGIHRDTETSAPDAQDLVQETTYLYPLQLSQVIRSNIQYLLRNPLHYIRGLWQSFSSPEFSLKRRAKMVYHYVVSVPMAQRMTAAGITHIHAHFLNSSASVAMYAAHHSRIPFSITVHSAGSYKAADTIGLHQKLQSAQFLIMISHFNVRDYDRVTPCRDKSFVVRCGMDLEGFSFRPLPPIHQPAQLLGVGRFVAKKGFRYLIEAAAELKSRHIPFILQLIGDGPLKSDLQSLTTQLDLYQHIRFLGQRNTAEVRQIMAESDVVIVPSITTDNGDMEGLPVVIMEAMAIGVPVVASNHAGIPEIVIPGQTGSLTPERDPIAIADAIEHLLRHPDPQRTAHARTLIEQNFDIDSVAQQRLNYFRRFHQ